MQFQSMTGFGRGESSGEKIAVTIEIKSVNNRFRDIRIKAPPECNRIELDLKKALSESFKRGSFDVYINIKRQDKEYQFQNINLEAIDELISKVAPISKKHKLEINFRPTDFLRSDFIEEQDIVDDDNFAGLIKQAFRIAVDKLHDSRSVEGKKMALVIKEHIKQYYQYVKSIDKHKDKVQEVIDQKIRSKINELQDLVEIDKGRLSQEITYLVEKADINEEVDRIKFHLEKLENVLNEGGAVGRQIDFIIQELNRETNTIGSKSCMEEISDNVVNMKLQLEKIREQGLNLE